MKEFMNRPEVESTNCDITFCMDDCEHVECMRHKDRPKSKILNSYGFLKNTEYCPYKDKEK